MKESEIISLIIATIILTIVFSFRSIISLQLFQIPKALFFAVLILAVSIASKKLIAYSLDSGVEHSIWKVYRFGFKPEQHFKKEMPTGIILPLFFSIISLGFIKFASVLTYETRALKSRASKRFGYYSFTEMTDWHNAVIGAAGIFSVLILSFISYFIPGLEGLSSLSAFYAFSNMIPFSNLDGTQIYFGSRVLWTTLATITLIFFAYAIFLV